MAQRWCYMRNGQECGPVTTADLRLLADQERLQPTDMVRSAGSTRWVEARTVKGLFYTGPASARGSGGRVAACLIVLAAVALLTAGGGAVVFYSFYGFGAPAASSPPPTNDQTAANTTGTPPGNPTGNTPDAKTPVEDPDLSDVHGGKVLGSHKERSFWRFGRGYFENTKGDQWREKNGDALFHYVEQARTPKYIELFDQSRNVTVQLHATQCDEKVNNGKFERKFDGSWEVHPD